MNSIAYFEIQSSNPERDVHFYKTIFQWDFILDKNLPIEYYRIETPTMLGGILKRPLGVPPMQYGTNAFVCSIQVQNFDNTSDLILKLGGQIAMPKFEIPGKCFQGYFIDLDNNTFGIFEAIQ